MLTAAEIDRVHGEHRLVDVLARAGVEPPARWNGRSFMVCCPMPGHDDSTPSMIVHADIDRYHCFGCGVPGDVLQLVMDLEEITSLTRAAELLGSRRAIRSFPGSHGLRRGARAVALSAVEPPDLARTPARRLLEINAEAWSFLARPDLAMRARRYLAGRGIEVRALEEEAGRPLAGHTPPSGTGLVEHRTREGFGHDELVDAGWVSCRPDGRIADRYRHRVLLPARDARDRVIGVYARDVTGRSGAKYLNTPDTAVFSKRRVLYRPVTGDLERDATVVVCEGSLDALAIAATAATADRSSSLAPVAPSGTALTWDQTSALLAIHDPPPVLCADGDSAGRAATATWAVAVMQQRRECLATLLPDGADPAEWLARHGSDGLAAFLRSGPGVAPGDGRPRPVPVGGIVASAICAELRQLGCGDGHVRSVALQRLGGLGARLPEPAARQCFATGAGRALADRGLDAAAPLTRSLAAAIGAARTPPPAIPADEPGRPARAASRGRASRATGVGQDTRHRAARPGGMTRREAGTWAGSVTRQDTVTYGDAVAL